MARMPDWWERDDLEREELQGDLPPGVEVFEAPHLFLLHTVLVYHRAMVSTGWSPRVLIFRLNRIHCLDHRGARSIALLARLCQERRTFLVLSEVHPEAWAVLGHQGVLDEVGPGNVFARWDQALVRVRAFLRPG